MNAPTDIRAMPAARAGAADAVEPVPVSSQATITIAITTPLQRLVTAALAAEDALLAPEALGVTEGEYARLDDAAITARVALREYLATQGLTVEQINRMGSVL